MERFPIRMPTTCPGTSSRGRRDGRGPRGRLAAAVAFVRGSSSAALPVARGSTAPGARTILDNYRFCSNIHTV
jgi:hypothetical protein